MSKNKYRSKLEKSVADKLKKLKLKFDYETERYKYVLPERLYLIDFKVIGPKSESNKTGETYLEVKGYLDYEDRLKMLAVKKAHPDLDIVFVFMKPHQKLPRQKMTHAEWAERNGFKWCTVETLETLLH